VVKFKPVPIELPPEDELYQFTVPEDVAVNTTVPGPHRDPLDKAGAAGG
jgi:hypothetical protein